ncbi:MAG: hypothetical protein ACRD8W_19920 [Nitrososphaeraceae archaeon]
MALGELFVEDRGKITGQRVLDVEGPKIESSFTMSGRYKGVEGTDMGTYYAVMRQGAEEGGVMYGERQGVVTTKDGRGMATWTGQGIGRFTGPGKISFRGLLFFHAPSATGGNLSSFKM